jgi:hypothetical protein
MIAMVSDARPWASILSLDALAGGVKTLWYSASRAALLQPHAVDEPG